MAGLTTVEGPPQPRPPSLLDAILPVVVLIALIALTIALFGVSATDGPLQVALLLSAAFASLIAFKNGYTAAVIALVGMVTGSSWTTAETLGVAFVAMANVMGLSEAAAAGAVICGAYLVTR